MESSTKTHCVIPFTFDSDSSKFVVLLGEPRTSKKKILRDFGGHPKNGSETPLQTATRCAFESSNGLIGTKKDIAKTLGTDFRIVIPGQGYVYLLNINPGLAGLLPAMHASNVRYILSNVDPCTISDESFPFKKLVWIPLEPNIEIGTADRKAVALDPITREAIRHVLAKFEMDVETKTLKKKELVPEEPAAEGGGSVDMD